LYLRKKIDKINQNIGASGSGMLREVEVRKTANKDNVRRNSLSMASYGGGPHVIGKS
jgi:hypothetical protein